MIGAPALGAQHSLPCCCGGNEHHACSTAEDRPLNSLVNVPPTPCLMCCCPQVLSRVVDSVSAPQLLVQVWRNRKAVAPTWRMAQLNIAAANAIGEQRFFSCHCLS